MPLFQFKETITFGATVLVKSKINANDIIAGKMLPDNIVGEQQN